MDHTKIGHVNLNSPCQELSIHGLGFVVARLVRWQNILSCACTGGAIQLYSLNTGTILWLLEDVTGFRILHIT